MGHALDQWVEVRKLLLNPDDDDDDDGECKVVHSLGRGKPWGLGWYMGP